MLTTHPLTLASIQTGFEAVLKGGMYGGAGAWA